MIFRGFFRKPRKPNNRARAQTYACGAVGAGLAQLFSYYSYYFFYYISESSDPLGARSQRENRKVISGGIAARGCGGISA